jgi:DNA-nicking Smr family endonuclease
MAMSRRRDRKGSPFDALAGLKKKLAEEEEARKTEKARPRPPSGGRSRTVREEPSSEEALEFHRLMSGVVPLEPKSVRVGRTDVGRSSSAGLASKRASAKSAAEEEEAAVHERLRELTLGDTRFEVEDDGRRVQGRRVDLPPDALRKLRRGLLPIDARLDLHGMRAGEARSAVEAFLGAKRARGERCVLVVHGKGEHSPRGDGVLRGEIAAWLSQGAASEHVAAFATATDHDGGEGAVYVLLRR